MSTKGPARIKGGALRPVLAWYERTYGRSAIQRALARVPPAIRADVELRDGMPVILGNTWYDARIVHAILDETVGTHPPADRPRIAREAAHAGIRETARGVYRFVLEQVVSPELYARHIQGLWRLLHDGGRREIHITSPGVAVSEIHDWPGHHPTLCMVTNETMAALFEAMGMRDVKITRECCVSDGAPLCRTHVTWRPL